MLTLTDDAQETLVTAAPRAAPSNHNTRIQVVARNLFATPVVVCNWPHAEALNAELRRAIVRRMEMSPGIVISNRAGWHSENDLASWPGECIQELLRLIEEAAAKMVSHVLPDAEERHLKGWRVSAIWANVNPAGGYNRSHNHVNDGGVLLSGVYYVDAGTCERPIDAGRLVFENRSGVPEPARADRDLFATECAVIPKAGTMVLFPAAQYHYVEPFRGTGTRISIAFNLDHPEFRAIYYPDMLQTEDWWWRNFRGVMLLKRKIPEKFKALALFASYAFAELRRANQAVPLRRRLKVALTRAQIEVAPKEATAIGEPQEKMVI